jgi:hypothetical protein
MDNNGNLGKYSWRGKSVLIRLFGPCRRICINHRFADNYQHFGVVSKFCLLSLSMGYHKDERIVNVTDFAPILIKVKFKGCWVMKMKNNGEIRNTMFPISLTLPLPEKPTWTLPHLTQASYNFESWPFFFSVFCSLLLTLSLRVDFGTSPSVEGRIQGISFFLQANIALIILSFRVLCSSDLSLTINSALLNSDATW